MKLLKRIRSWIIIFLFIVLAIAMLNQNVFAIDINGSCYKIPDNPYYYEHGGQCTAFAWGRACEKTGINLIFKTKSYPSAKYWYLYGPQDSLNLNTGTTVQADSIAVWEGDSTNEYGHVAYVERVDNGTVYFNEANIETYNGSTWGGGYDGYEKSRTVYAFEHRGTGVGNILGYIYLSPPNKNLVRVSGTDPVYWLQNGKLYWVTSADVINQMSSLPGWGIDQINDYSIGVFDPNDYEEGPRFISTNSSSNGLLIRLDGGTDVYLINNGQKEHISYEAFIQAGYDWNDIIDVPQAILDMFSDETLSVSLEANPSSGDAPLDVSLTADVSGTATGTINYTFWWDCNDPGKSVDSVSSVCGDPWNSTYGAKFDEVWDDPKAVSHTYSAAGTYTAKVIAERGNAPPVENRITISVNTSPEPPSKATSASPSNGATNISISTDASWSDGGGATSYDIYFGTDSTPDSGEYKGNQTSTSYDPGPLDYDKTYYWRIDAKNSDGTTTGDVWNFTTGLASPEPHIASISPTEVEASTFDLTVNGSNFDEGAVDQIYWKADDHFVGQGTVLSQSSTQLVVREYMEGADPGVYQIEVMNSDGKRSNRVDLVITAPTSELPSKATSPSPSNGATGQSINTDLSWSNGGGTTSYDVYFGTNSNPDSGFKGNQTSTSYDPGTLNYNTTYCWRIDAKNSDGTTMGDVWNFTTQEDSIPSTGSIRVSIVPQEAADTGAQWRELGESSWRNSGTIKSNVPFGTYTIEFKDISGWNTPPNKDVTVSAAVPDPWINSDLYVDNTQTCTYSISHASKSFDSSGGSDSVSVTTQSDCSWTAVSYDDWITITSGSSGSGDGTVNYSVSSNSSVSLRTGTMTIAGKTFTVTQEGENGSPTADAGPDQTVDERETVVLDGSNSSDPDDGIASYQWVQMAGPSVTLSNIEAVQPTFTAPNVGTEGATLTFQLTVSDNGGLQDTNTITINISNKIIAGDIDDSGTITLSDAIMAIQICIGITPAATVYKEADVNNDGKIGLEELIYILQTVSGLRENSAPIKNTLTVNKTGSGTITSSPPGIDCGNDCSAEFEDGTAVTLTITADTGWEITGFNIEGCGGESFTDEQICALDFLHLHATLPIVTTFSCTIFVDELKTVAVTFEPQ